MNIENEKNDRRIDPYNTNNNKKIISQFGPPLPMGSLLILFNTGILKFTIYLQLTSFSNVLTTY